MISFARRTLVLATPLSLAALAALVSGRACAAERIKIRDLYRTQAEFSERAQALQNQTVQIPGFMAPPLKPDATFFVLTKLPMAVCPFCNDGADWPTDIVLVRLKREQEWIDFNRSIVVTGTLELGIEVDEETGFVSKVRLTDAAYELG